MRLILSAYKTKLVVNMIIKRNLKNKCIISMLRSVVHVLLFTSGNPNLCAYDMRLWAVISLYLTLTYMKYILEQISNATVFNFRYFSSDVSYQAFFFFRLGVSEVMK